jgi:hypothetical protein
LFSVGVDGAEAISLEKFGFIVLQAFQVNDLNFF